MKCYLIRHGKDDDTVRGGWSASPLTEAGVRQVEDLAERLSEGNFEIKAIYSSDLPRARQTADILAKTLMLPVIETPQFRETNNGVLAGMDNELAKRLYPGLYWSALDWEQSYPEGESPCAFYTRIRDAWYAFKKQIQSVGGDVILVTHGGVINVIRCIESGIQYSNKSNPFPTSNAETVEIEV